MHNVITFSDAMPYEKVVFSLCNHNNNAISLEKKADRNREKKAESLWIDGLFEIRKIVVCFLWFLLPGDCRVTDEALLADPPSFLLLFSLLLKDLISDFDLK